MKTKWGHKFADLYKDRTNPSLPFNKEEWEEDAMQYYNWNAEWLKMPTQTREDLEKNYNKYEAKRDLCAQRSYHLYFVLDLIDAENFELKLTARKRTFNFIGNFQQSPIGFNEFC